MLTALRRQASSWVAKVLLILLAASFGLWGVGDIFGGFNDPVVAEVGDFEIRASDFLPEYNAQVSALRRSQGANFDLTAAIRAGIHHEILDSMVSRALVHAEGEEHGIRAGERDLAGWLRTVTEFQDASGGFSRDLFTFAARRRGLHEEEYLEYVADLRRSQHLINSISLTAHPSDRVLRALHGVRNERREARAAVFLASESPEPEPAGDGDVRARYDGAAESEYRVPEFRNLSAAVLDPEELKAEVELGEDELAEEFERRRDQYLTPERRRVVQFLAADAAEAEEVMALVRGGQDLAGAAAEAAGADPGALDLGLVAREDLDPDLAAAAFAAEAGIVTGPEETPFGHRLLEITEVEEATDPTLDGIRDRLRDEVALERAYDLIHERAEIFYDEIAGGASLEEAARTAGTGTVAIAGVDSAGRDGEGAGLPDPDDIELVRFAFGIREGDTTDLEELPDGRLAAVRVEAVTPSRKQTLEEARGDILDDLAAEARRADARARAEAFAAEAPGAGDLKALAEAHGGSLRTSGPFTRSAEGAAGAFPREAVAAAFLLDEGETGEPVGLGAGGYAVVTLEAVLEAEEPDGEAREGLAVAVRASLGDDILTSFVGALREAHPVKTDPAALDRAVLGGDTSL